MHRLLRLNARTFPVLPEERAALALPEYELECVELPEECAAAAAVEAVLIVSAYFRRETMARFPNLRLISRLGNGCDKIDLEAAAERGIPVVNVPDAFSGEVADHTVAMLLALLRKLPAHDAMMRGGRRPYDVFGVRRLSTLTAGIFGFGRIGRLIGARLKAFGMTVVFSDPAVAGDADGARRVSPPELLAISDAVILQCPLLDSTRGMMNGAAFEAMKPGAVFVNTARGELVCERELAAALRSGRLAGAALDVFGEINVFAEGGFPTDHPLFAAPNCLLSPHVAANSVEGRSEAHRRGAEAVDRFFRNLPLEHVVNAGGLKCRR